jgi:hypothetical protein
MHKFLKFKITNGASPSVTRLGHFVQKLGDILVNFLVTQASPEKLN